MIQPGPVSRVSSAPPAGGLIGLGPLLAVTPTYLTAEVLLAHTHHRPLGAVAFATAALAYFVVGEAFVRLALTEDGRLSSLMPGRARGRRWLRGGSWALGVLGALACVARALLG
ncbi:MAG TPA: hypothetical protein VLC09_07600 [Polyangiaceae bacterium]|nr:hypothetical protein [Polyangiaceae bacterium]